MRLYVWVRKSIDLGGFCITIQGAIFVRELDKEFEAGQERDSPTRVQQASGVRGDTSDHVSVEVVRFDLATTTYNIGRLSSSIILHFLCTSSSWSSHLSTLVYTPTARKQLARETKADEGFRKDREHLHKQHLHNSSRTARERERRDVIHGWKKSTTLIAGDTLDPLEQSFTIPSCGPRPNPASPSALDPTSNCDRGRDWISYSTFFSIIVLNLYIFTSRFHFNRLLTGYPELVAVLLFLHSSNRPTCIGAA
ncbi:hypothetical protein B0H13DRAFT_1852454 [Mycena leptocephala]|nr:hypothetical protein B0H13DRAFT_1852454 [Mycena leptocephala]